MLLWLPSVGHVAARSAIDSGHVGTFSMTVRSLPSRLFHALFRHADRSLDSTLGGAWQRLKWKLKYHLRRVPDFEALIARPDRILLRDIILRERPRSLLEFGCGRGANLILLWKANPSLQLQGFDLSATAIESARSAARAAGAIQIEFAEGTLSRLSSLDKASVDVVLAESVLMYIPPASIRFAIEQMLRVSRKAVVLTAWHDEMARSRYDDGAWLYNFRQIVGEIPSATLQILAYPTGTWNDTRWVKFGAVVIVRSSASRDPA